MNIHIKRLNTRTRFSVFGIAEVKLKMAGGLVPSLDLFLVKQYGVIYQ